MISIDDLSFPSKCYKAERVFRSSENVENAFPHITDWSLAIDVGAYVGTMTVRMAQRFERVIAIEPVPEAFECLKKNVPGNVEVLNLSCGAKSGVFPYARQPDSGHAHFLSKHIEKYGEFGVSEMVRLDDLSLNPGFIKIDAEFTDEQVIEGSVETIRRCRPVLMVEFKGRKDAVKGILKGHGYEMVWSNKIDGVFVGTG